MKTEFVALGDVCESIRGVTFAGNEAFPEKFSDSVACLTTSGVQEEVNWESRRFVPRTSISNSKQLLAAGDILVSTANSKELVGKSCLIETLPFECTFGAFVTVIRPNSKVVSRWLAFWMKTQEFLAKCYLMSSNTTNISNLRTSELLEFQILLPPLPEQRRLAALLDKADRLRRLHRYALELSETYLQSVFLEMFGDLVRNPKGWERTTISELGEVQTGNTPPRDNPEFYGDYIEWIKSDNILDGEMLVSQSREMLSEEGLEQGRVVEAGAVLVTCIAGSLTSVGDIGLTNRKVAFNQQINAVTPNDDVDSVFLYGLLQAAKPLIQHNASAGMKHIITKSKIEELTLIKPPLELQRRFARAALKFERLRAQQREALRQAEMLFGALLKRAFAGEA